MKRAARSLALLLGLAPLAGLGAATITCPAPITPAAGSVEALLEAELFLRSGSTSLITNDPNDNYDSVEFTSNGNLGDTCGGSGCVSITFTAAVSCQYKFQSRVLAPDNNSNSYFFTLMQGGGAVADDCGVSTARHRFTPNGSYQWVYVTDDSNNGDHADNVSNARVWTLSAGTVYTMVFKAREDDLRLDQVRARQFCYNAPTPTPSVTPAPGSGTGLCASYYNNTGVSGTAALTRLDASVDFTWPSSPAPGTVNADNFSVRWQGQIEAPAMDSYVFSLLVDDGVRLWIDGALVVDSWGAKAGAVTVTAAAPVIMTANSRHDLVLEYNSLPGLADIHLRWASGGISPAQIVPSSRLYPCAAGSPTPTWTPTPSPTPAPSYLQGLSRAAHLYELEYIPFPAVTSGGTTLYDLAATFTTAASNAVPKNTARWRIEFQGLASTVGNQVQVETRIGPYGVSCTTGYYDPSDYASTTTLSLPPRPQNLSTTYFWLSPSAVPLTERIDAMGDPRFVPYLDVLDAPAGAYAGGYNWFFRPLQTDASGVPYRTFATSADYDRYGPGAGSQVSVDIPKLMALWREAVLGSRSIFTSMTGWSEYYIGLGGEIGGDTNNQLNGGVPAYGGPWNAGGSADRNEITGAAVLVRTATWKSKPWLGELWPDSLYASDWSSSGSQPAWGNLANIGQSGTAYRDSWANLGYTSYPLSANQHRLSAWGCASFMNAGSGATPFNHSSNDNTNGDILADASTMSLDYHFSSPAVFPAWRPWGLGQGGNVPSEWSLPPYSTSRPVLDIYQHFYDHNVLTGATQRSSAAIRSVLAPKAGYLVVNGLSPSTDTGINFTARFAILSCLRTFHEAGVPTASAVSIPNPTKNVVNSATYRIEPVPLIEITDPVIGKETRGQSTISIAWQERFVRWDGERYTADYPCPDADSPPCAAANPSAPGDPAKEWHSSEPLGYNLKYSPDGGSSWYSILTGLTTTAGEMLDGADMILGKGGTYKYSYAWSVGSMPAGTKLLRVECYRRNIPQHYGYHELPVGVRYP